MARRGNTDMERKLKQLEEALENTESLLLKAKNETSNLRSTLIDLRKASQNLTKMKDNLPQDAADHRKRIEQKLEAIKQTINDKQNFKLSQDEKKTAIESVIEIMDTLKTKMNEFRSQIGGLATKKGSKGKNAQKGEKLDRQVGYIDYHYNKLANVKKFLETSPVTPIIVKDEAFNEIENFFQNYIANQEYIQHNDSVDQYYEQLSGSGSTEQQNTGDSENNETANQFEESKDGKFLDKAPKFDMNAVRELGFREEKTKISVITEPQKKSEFNFFAMLENSFANMPRENDMFPTVLTKEKTTNQTLLPKRRMIEEKSFEKMDVDTLFAIFFFQKGTYDQYLAAEELKKRTWRFHKKHLSWFKRCEQPKVMTDEYEEGTYYSIDYENNDWAQRKKQDFMIRYSYLEKD